MPTTTKRIEPRVGDAVRFVGLHPMIDEHGLGVVTQRRGPFVWVQWGTGGGTRAYHGSQLEVRVDEDRLCIMRSAMDGWMPSILTNHLDAARRFLVTRDAAMLEAGDPPALDAVDALVMGRWWCDELGLSSTTYSGSDGFWVWADSLNGRPVHELGQAMTREQAARWILDAWEEGR